MTDQPSMEDLRKKRVLAGMQMLTSIVVAGRPEKMDDYGMCVASLRADLTEAQRTDLLFMLIRSFPADVAEDVCKLAFIGAGWPQPSLMGDPLSDARFWASDANSKELKAYAIACADRMSPSGKKALHEWLGKKVGGK